MDKRIALPAGLALMVALAVVGMLSVFSFTATQSAEASIGEISQGIGNDGDLAKFEQPLKTPLQSFTTAVTAAAATIDPEDPGDLTSLTVTFRTSASGALANGSGKIILLFDADDWTDEFPTSIDKSTVTISADSVTNLGGNGGPNEAVQPQSVTVDFVGNENDLPQVTLLVGDMSTDDNTGGNGIDALANVTIVFQQAAGINNPAEGGDFDIEISTSADTDPATSDTTATVTVPIIIELSDVNDPRGDTITAIAKGIKGGTVTFWLDKDADGVRDAGEIDLCSGNENNKSATCDFIVNNPPFTPGKGTDCSPTFTGGKVTAGSISGCNYVNAIDGENVTVSQRNLTDFNRSVFNLKGLVEVSPDEGDPGDTITVQLKDYPAGALTAVTLAGVSITSNSSGAAITSEVVPASGEHNFTIKIPDGVPSGDQVLFVFDSGGGDEDTTLTVGSARLTATPSSVVANQRISVIGTGFTEGGAATINKSGDGSVVTIGGETIHTSKINDGASIEVDNGGSWSASFDLPVTSATTTDGPRELKITDSGGREGKVDIIFPERTISLTPEEGRVSTNVTVRGAGFAAKNNDGNSITVEVEYDAGGGGTNTATATPDASGNWSVTVQVPSDSAIPSTNTVKAEFDLFTANTQSTKSGSKAITTVTHRVPEAQITISQLSGPPGTTVSLDAVGFKRFTPVKTLEVGDIDVTPSPKPSTGPNGDMSFDFIIPGSDTGVQTVELDVGGTTASVGFTVTDASGGADVVTPIEDALIDPLGDNLDRAFFFNNVSKDWNFHINDPVFGSSNDLEEVGSGLPIWVKVTEDTSVELNNVPFDLTCVNPGTAEEDCWNLIVFP